MLVMSVSTQAPSAAEMAGVSERPSAPSVNGSIPASGRWRGTARIGGDDECGDGDGRCGDVDTWPLCHVQGQRRKARSLNTWSLMIFWKKVFLFTHLQNTQVNKESGMKEKEMSSRRRAAKQDVLDILNNMFLSSVTRLHHMAQNLRKVRCNHIF